MLKTMERCFRRKNYECHFVLNLIDSQQIELWGDCEHSWLEQNNGKLIWL
jgi:hypothetical protein